VPVHGETLWTYLTTPFLLAMDDVRVDETKPRCDSATGRSAAEGEPALPQSHHLFVFMTLACIKTPRIDMIPLGFAGNWMKGFIEGADRGQLTLFPECLDDWIDEGNAVRVIDSLSASLISVSSVSAGSIQRRRGDPHIIPGFS
jgi:hypothetical protein